VEVGELKKMGRIQQKGLAKLRHTGFKGPLFNSGRDLTDEVKKLLANPDTPLEKISLNYDSEGASHFGGGQLKASDLGEGWTVMGSKNKKTVKSATQPGKLIGKMLAGGKEKSSSSSSSNSSSSSQNLSSSRDWGPIPSWDRPENVWPQNSELSNSPRYNQQFPNDAFSSQQSRTDKKELESRQRKEQRDLERAELTRKPRGEPRPPWPPSNRSGSGDRRELNSSNQSQSSSERSKFTRVSLSSYDKQVELKNSNTRNSLSVSGGTIEATTESVSSEDKERPEAAWNNLTEESLRKATRRIK
jgi:hypothetical protein